jgi:type IV pilus biogenesis protein CpaD/CtpE
MQSTPFKGILGGLLAAALLAGCAATSTPNLDAKFGQSMNTLKAQQIINPDASRNTDPVAGIDGQAANAIIDRYHKGYEAPAPALTGTIGSSVGGIGTTLK